MESDGSGNQSRNTSNTVIIYGDNASPVFASFSILLSTWIIVANIIILSCFIRHKNKVMNSSFAFQILTLSLNDLIVGVSTIPVYISSFAAQTGFEFCAFRLVLFMSAQVVVLFHILGLCLNRLFIVFQASKPLRRPKKRGLILSYLFITWMITLIIFTLPFFIWGKYRRKLSICSLNEMFQDSYKVVVSYCLVFYVAPFVLTNVAYLVIILKLTYSTRKITPLNSENVEMEEITDLHSIQCDSKSKSQKSLQKRTFVSASTYSQQMPTEEPKSNKSIENNKVSEMTLHSDISGIPARPVCFQKVSIETQNKDFVKTDLQNLEATETENKKIVKTDLHNSEATETENKDLANGYLHKVKATERKNKNLVDTDLHNIQATETDHKDLVNTNLHKSEATETDHKNLVNTDLDILEATETDHKDLVNTDLNDIKAVVKIIKDKNNTGTTNSEDKIENTNPLEETVVQRPNPVPTFRNQRRALTTIGTFSPFTI